MCDAKPRCSCFDVSHSGQRGESPTAPFQIASLGQSLFLFSPVCSQSHSEASGPKVSWSIILILHCKQTGCILLRCRTDTEISSLSAADITMCFQMADTLIVESLLQDPSPADSKDDYGPCHAMYYAKSCSFPKKKLCEVFRAELN